MKHPIPDDALDDRLGFVGTAGSGKTYCAGTCVERLLAQNARVVIVDPLDVWWGLRLSPDGATPSRHKIVIVGGAHGDLELTNERAGALIGETVATAAESFIVSLRGLGTKAAERRFMLAFLTTLYRHANGEPVHLIFDEADLWAPQRLLDKEGEAAKLLGQMETIVRRGRIEGFIPWLITQRPAVLSKDVLSQVDGLVAFKLTSSQDRDAIGDWVQGQADKEQWRAIWSSLPTMQRGHGVVWVPGRGILKTAAFPEKRTFDSSATPKRGEKKRRVEVAPLNVEALKTRIENVAVQAVENDPARLKKRIAELERELKAKPLAPAVDVETIKREHYEAGFRTGMDALRQFVTRWHQEASESLDQEMGAFMTQRKRIFSEATPAPKLPAQPRPPETVRPTIEMLGGRKREPVTRSESSDLPRGERACLIAIAQHAADGGVTRAQLTLLAGYKKSSRDTYISRLRERGFVEVDGDRVRATVAGEQALGDDYEPLPTGAELRQHWLTTLPEGEARVLRAVVDAWPDAVDREAISAATGYKKSSRDTYLSRLSARELVTTDRGVARAADKLME